MGLPLLFYWILGDVREPPANKPYIKYLLISSSTCKVEKPARD